MKKIILFTALLLSLLNFTACKKEASTNTTASTLLTSKAVNIKQGEPVVFKISSVQDTAGISWAVTPKVNTQISPTGSQSIIVFKAKGQYTVSASFKGQSVYTIVNVGDSVYTDTTSTGSYSVISNSLAEDQITLTPSLAGDSTNYISISAVTKNRYNCLNNSLAYTLTTGNNAYSINFTGVNSPDGSGCIAGTKTGTAFTTLYAPEDGTYTFSVILNGITYNVSFVKSAKKYTFTWSYTSGVLISPLTINN